MWMEMGESGEHVLYDMGTLSFQFRTIFACFLKCGEKDWRKIIISLTILIFYVWIFVFTYSAIWRSFRKELFLAFNFRVDMLDLASHSTLRSSLIPFVLCLYVYGSPNLLLFLFFQPRSVHK